MKEYIVKGLFVVLIIASVFVSPAIALFADGAGAVCIGSTGGIGFAGGPKSRRGNLSRKFVISEKIPTFVPGKSYTTSSL